MILINEASHPLLALAALSAGLLISESLFAWANRKRDDVDDVIADPQSNAASDRASTQKICRPLTADQSLSTNAHNVKISMTNAEVTLKGRLNSEDEKQQMASKATEVVDASKVENQLTVNG